MICPDVDKHQDTREHRTQLFITKLFCPAGGSIAAVIGSPMKERSSERHIYYVSTHHVCAPSRSTVALVTRQESQLSYQQIFKKKKKKVQSLTFTRWTWWKIQDQTQFCLYIFHYVKDYFWHCHTVWAAACDVISYYLQRLIDRTEVTVWFKIKYTRLFFFFLSGWRHPTCADLQVWGRASRQLQ